MRPPPAPKIPGSGELRPGPSPQQAPASLVSASSKVTITRPPSLKAGEEVMRGTHSRRNASARDKPAGRAVGARRVVAVVAEVGGDEGEVGRGRLGGEVVGQRRERTTLLLARRRVDDRVEVDEGVVPRGVVVRRGAPSGCRQPSRSPGGRRSPPRAWGRCPCPACSPSSVRPVAWSCSAMRLHRARVHAADAECLAVGADRAGLHVGCRSGSRPACSGSAPGR